jgi:hypothetical protein
MKLDKSKKSNKNKNIKWRTPVITVLGRLRQEDCEFEASLGYIVRPCFKKTKNRNKIKVKNNIKK